jgi:hypothetical protein
MWRRILYVLVGVSVTACAAAGPSSRPRIATVGRDVLTAAEIVASRVTDVYQAVSQLRPEFLRKRPVIQTPLISGVSVQVYLDDMQFGGVESLRSIPLDRVRTIRYVGAIDADLRWGGSHPAGVILVTTLK